MNERLARDHADLDKLLDDLRVALEATDITRSHERLDLFWARLAVHIRAEHLHLFPAILRALSGNLEGDVADAPSLSQAQKTIAELRRDHDFFMHELSRAIIAMRNLVTTMDWQAIGEALEKVRVRIAAVEERLATHNKLEEERVYLWIRKVLSEAEQVRLARA